MSNPTIDQRSRAARDDHLDFRTLFSEANAHFVRSADLRDSKTSFSEVLVTSAIAKCLDFNNQANEGDSAEAQSSFFLIANARAICEEFIYCSLFRSIGQPISDDLAMRLNDLATKKNVLAQTRFFAHNNPAQPTFGGFADSAKLNEAIRQASRELNSHWKSCGFTQVPPSVQEVSNKVGLTTTYGYTYHLTSNFVHFNPGQLLQTGWGAGLEGPFTFSTKNFEGYYINLARFLGAIFFLGYCYIAPDKFQGDLASEYARLIQSRLQSNFRWPEITTYEEMNQTWPDNILERAMMTVMRKEDPTAMPDVLSELQGLAGNT
ncbi:MAG: hypothetical protein F4X77_17885 [Acidobacteriia bacterium]|nr:hypothetical protein [Terriglobia bacterium]